MTHFQLQKWPRFVLRIGFGILLIVAAIDKIRYPHDFARMVDNYRVLGLDLSYWAAVFVPYLEVIVGVCLIAGLWMDAASVINSILMIVFLGLVSQAYFRGLDIHCGCFSVSEEGGVIGPVKLLTNFIYAVMSVYLLILVLRQPREA